MARKLGTKRAIERLRELEVDGPNLEHTEELKTFLAHTSNHVAARAADLIRSAGLDALIAEVESAFERFMEDPVKSDPGCTAKLAIVRCLSEFEHPAADLYLRGARHRQLEPAWGKPEDSAPGLRGASGRALAIIRHPDVYRVHADLLSDAEAETRRLAVETLSSIASEQSELMLRMKLHAGDDEPGVLAEAFKGLMQHAPLESIDIVANFLGHDDMAIAEGAALALGESKRPEAFEALRAAWDANLMENYRCMLTLPVALLRSDAAFDFLCDGIATASVESAAALIRALALYAGDPACMKAVRKAVAAREEPELAQTFEDAFIE